MEDASRAKEGYFGRYLARMAPAPLPPPPLPLPASSTPDVLTHPGRKTGKQPPPRNDTSRNKKAHAVPKRRALADAFKQHGVKLCDGSKLNVVSKGVTHIGLIPPTLATHVTSLYLSQNDLRSLEGVEQFQSVRLLSIGGNLVARFSEVARLVALKHLRHLNLTGNPVCEQPNYRFRVIDALPQMQVLDTCDISKRERELAPVIASQDQALRDMIMKNHLELLKLQRVVQWILVLKEFHGVVLREAASGKFDRLPRPDELSLNVDRFLRIWKYEDTLGSRAKEDLLVQMMVIVARTRARLSEHPRTKAKELLLKLANAPAASGATARRLNTLPTDIRQQYTAWEDAYTQVLHLQQQILVSVRAQCDRNSRTMMASLREILITNPLHRGETSKKTCWSAKNPALRESCRDLNPSDSEDLHHVSAQVCLPLQQHDPDVCQPRQHVRTGDINGGGMGRKDGSIRSVRHQYQTRRALPTIAPATVHTAQLRSGDFGNKTLHEAVHSFQLRQPSQHVTSARRVGPTSAPEQSRDHTNPAYIENLPRANTLSTGRAHQSSMEFKNPLHRLRSTRSFVQDEFRDHDSNGFGGSDTVVSFDTRYAPSLNGSLEASGEENSIQTIPLMLASSLQQSHQSDMVEQEWMGRQYHLRTVAEEQRSDSDDSSLKDQSRRFSTTELDNRESSRHMNNTPKILQHELDDREEKYIKALMESEQRELDLRREINGMCKQITQYRNSLAETATERQQIKFEVGKRVQAIATPKILKRFFVQWIQFYQWSLQLQHISRKRRFVLQHDTFWMWRRRMWVQEQLRRTRHRYMVRLVRAHFTEWANLTRISVIAAHTQALRQAQLLKRVLVEWHQQTHVLQLTRNMRRGRMISTAASILACTFREWKRLSTLKRQLLLLQQYSRRDRVTLSKRLFLSQWKIYILSVARPCRHTLFEMSQRRVLCSRRKHFNGWKNVTRASRFLRRHLYRSAWSVWHSCLRHKKSKQLQAVNERRNVLSRYFSAWFDTTGYRGTLRRASNMATRFVSQRRKRKLWMHWKIFCLTRKRYKQGSTKALKHYFKKLLRGMWKVWRKQARHNLLRIREKKSCELKRHFAAFCCGIRRSLKTQKLIAQAQNMIKRRGWSRLRQYYIVWWSYLLFRRRCKVYSRILHRQRSRNLIGYAWGQWKTQRLLLSHRSLGRWRQNCDVMSKDKQEVEDELLMLNDRSLTLSKHVTTLSAQCEAQANDIRSYQDNLLESENAIAKLEQEIDAKNDECKRLSDELQGKFEEDKVKNDDLLDQHRALIHENQSLQAKLIDLERLIESANRNNEALTSENSTLETRLGNQHRCNEQLVDQYEAQAQSLQRIISDLNQQLGEEQREREEIANRLQEYEHRIASTCAEVGQNERAHEEEALQLRADFVHMQSLWKEESARNTELQNLMKEKNEKIMSLTVQVNKAKTIPTRSLVAEHLNHVGLDGDAPIEVTRPAPDSSSDVSEHAHLSLESLETNGRPHCPMIGNTTTTRADTASLSECVGHHDSVCPQALANVTHQHCDGNGVATRPDCAPHAEEDIIEARTSKVHADIRLLQERITMRLAQVPCLPAVADFVRHESSTGSAGTSCISEFEDAPSEGVSRRVKRSTTVRCTRKEIAPIPRDKPTVRRIVGRKHAKSSPCPRTPGAENTPGNANTAHVLSKTPVRATYEPYPQRTRVDSVQSARPKKRAASRVAASRS